MSLTFLVCQMSCRITAAYAIIIGFHATLYKYLAIGPINYIEEETEGCKNAWWWNMLYLNNFRMPSCTSQSYVSAYNI